MMLFVDAHLDDVTVKERKLPPPLGKGVSGERGVRLRAPRRGRARAERKVVRAHETTTLMEREHAR